MNKVVKNYIYNLSFQFINLLIPLLTVPYLARVLGAEGVGTFAYNYSIATMFSQFIILGMGNYGNRCIAKCLDDRIKLSKTFSELFYLEIISGILVISFYIVYTLTQSLDLNIALLLLPVLLASMFDVNWYLYGRENFKIISLRGILIKIFTTASIFIFVKEQSDVWIYVLIMSSSILLTQIIAWPVVLREVSFVRVRFSGIIRHFKPNLVLFVPIVAVSIYRTISKIMLGSISTITEVGYFENAEKIVSAFLSIIVALGTVMLPRMTALFEEKNEVAIISFMRKTFIYTAIMSSLFCFGTIAISEDLVFWFLGEEFDGSIDILRILCLTVPFICFANIIRTQILIPRCLDYPFVVSSIAGALINLFANLFLIKLLGGFGAALSTLMAETVVFIVQYHYCKDIIDKYLNKRHMLTLIYLYLYALFVAAILLFTNRLISLSSFQSLALETLIGTILYVLFLSLHFTLSKDVEFKEFINDAKRIFWKK